jgi:ABC-type transport system involved in multi-copper enzyme maturation permease subunit
VKIGAIATNTFREAVRDKVLYSLLFFALGLIVASVALNRLAIGQQAKIITDLGLASISIFGTLIAVFVGIGLVSKEIERRTIYTIVSKPVGRGRFILGKYLGLLLTLAVEVAIMGACCLAMIGVYTDGLAGQACLAMFLIFMELAVITAVALLFSAFSTPFLSGLFTLGVWVIGHLTADLKVFGEKAGGVTQALTEALYLLLPNLRNFNVKDLVVHGVGIPPELVILSTMYGIVYVGLLLAAATLIFQRRDFV